MQNLINIILSHEAEKIPMILKSYQLDINSFFLDRTPLQFAIQDKHLGCIKVLLENGADPNLGNENYGFPLKMAVSNNFYEITNLLLEFGANVDQADQKNQETALHFAVFSSNERITKLLLSFGANPFLKDEFDETPIDLATDKVLAFLKDYSIKFIDYSPSLFDKFINPYQMDTKLNKREYSIDFPQLKEIQHIANGAFGSVFIAEYKDKYVAVKKFSNLHGYSLELFEREISVLCKCNHPNIIQIIGYHYPEEILQKNQTENKENDKNEEILKKSEIKYDPCIVLEYLPKGTLYEKLKNLKRKKVKLKHPIIVRYAKDIAEGMKYLHSLKFIHRDLKSSNILITEDNHLKIIDFGYSRYEAKEYDLDPLTFNTGTLNWMAPEILRKESKYTSKVDVYSYGLVLWEIVFRQVPYRVHLQSVRNYDLRNEVGYKKVRPQLPITKQAPQEIIDLIKKCWKQNPDSRPSFDEICKILSNIKF
ncbi:mitogen-activated protein kinase kinase kinase [Anaeramoeba ignava]|uniref:Mitogen-activated protein kinase kinase kinase n=1 Tax=Anaeramoeba ignava TaxID=1746090 RepID=A0A9Q0LF18_ANAIG|nr:mitogen-activated protein kinase kinase kinase [Anaeramoeba ignava]